MNDLLAKRGLLWNIGEKLVDIIIFLFVAFPIFWIIRTAFMTDKDSYTTKVIFKPVMTNFISIFTKIDAGKGLINSLIIASITVLIAVPIGMMAAFTFSRYDFKLNKIIMVYILTCQFIPPVVVVLPYFNVFRKLGIVDTQLSLILVNLSISLPYAIWLLKGYVDAMPQEIEEAANIDGASRLQILRRVTIPLIMPGIITSSVFIFIQCWNEFMYALILTRVNAKTITIVLNNCLTSEGLLWNWMSSVGLLVMVPVFLLSMSIRKYFVEGLTAGGVK